MELLSSPYNYCCRAFPSINDGVGQEELLHVGLPIEEDEGSYINTMQLQWVRGTSAAHP